MIFALLLTAITLLAFIVTYVIDWVYDMNKKANDAEEYLTSMRGED